MTERWYKYRIKVAWPEGEEPRWWVDLFLADVVFRSIAEIQTIAGCPWRFHRRASRDDEDGHLFSFLTRTNASAAEHIKTTVSKNPELRRLRALGYVERASVVRLGAAVSATSDESWDPVLREAWPHFIQGASQMLLTMLEKTRPQACTGFLMGDGTEDLRSSFQNIYERMEERVNEVWQNDGSHALFHHLNALFGYRPTIIRMRDVLGVVSTL